MKNIKFLLYTLLLSFLIIGCDAKSGDQDPSEVGSSDYKPTLTVTPSVQSGNVDKGTTITYTLSVDKPMEFDIYFKASLIGGTASERSVELGTTKLARYTNQTEITVDIVDDGLPEKDKTALIRIEADGLDSEFWIIPNNTLPEFNYTIKSLINPTDLVVGLGWDEDDAEDMDMFVFSDEEGPWSYAATSDNPEVTNVIWGNEPDGVYFIGFDPYDVNSGVESINYTFYIGTPDGTISTIAGAFDYINRDTAYEIKEWVDGTVVYLLLKVVKTGSSFVVTSL